MDAEILKAEILKSARRDLKGVEKQLWQLEMPVDFEQLCRDGVLKKMSQTLVRGRPVRATFRILDRKRLPDHAALRLQITETTRTTTKRASAERPVTKCTGKLLNEGVLRRKLLRMKKVLAQLIGH